MPKQGKNIYLRKDGRWEGRYPKGRKSGKLQYRYVFGKSREEVEQKLNAFERSIEEVNACPAVSFESVSEAWLRIRVPELKVSSMAKYTNTLRSYLIPRFGTMDICAISRNEVVDFSRDLLTTGGVGDNGLAPKTVNSTLSVLKNIFEFTTREKNLKVADIADISVKQPQKPMRILSRCEQQRLSQFLCENRSPSNLGILLCLYTGLRIGEICALRWEDVCIAEQYLFVHQTMQRIQVSGNSGKKTEVIIQPPKSDCSIRKIPLPDEMLQFLKPAQAKDQAFFLTGLTNCYVEPRSMENHFKVVTKECEIVDVNFHALRHTFATRCVELGFDIKSLSEILGHASVNITLNRYVHTSLVRKQTSLNWLSDFLSTE